MWRYIHSDELFHHGVKGMKWGVRRTPEQLGHPRKKQQTLINSLIARKEKCTPADILMIDKDHEGNIFWLEKGNYKAGLEHIIEKHERNFADVGIKKYDIPKYICSAIKTGRIVGQQGNGKNPRPIYEFDYRGEKRRLAIQIGSNGFIVSANPKNNPRNGDIAYDDKI